jgi:hypothetical protein
MALARGELGGLYGESSGRGLRWIERRRWLSVASDTTEIQISNRSFGDTICAYFALVKPGLYFLGKDFCRLCHSAHFQQGHRHEQRYAKGLPPLENL